MAMKNHDEMVEIVKGEAQKLTSDLVLKRGIPIKIVLAGMHAHASDGIMASEMVGRWRWWSHDKIKPQGDEMSALMGECCDKLDAALSGMSILAKAIIAEGMGLPLAAMLDSQSDLHEGKAIDGG